MEYDGVVVEDTSHLQRKAWQKVAEEEGRPVPPLFALPPGCAFAPRCPKADDLCRRERPTYDQKQPGHWAACWHTNG